MSELRGLSFSPAGLWTERQLARVLEVLEPEAAALGFVLKDIEVTTNGDVCRWFLLEACCALHGTVVPVDLACPECLRERNRIRTRFGVIRALA